MSLNVADSTAQDAGRPADKNIGVKLADAIISGLYAGRFAPGQRLVESDLMRQYSVGRSSVREALNNLQARRFIDIVRHRGACIRMLSRREAHETIAVLQVLNGLLARLAAQNIDAPGARTALKAAFKKMAAEGANEPLADVVAKRNAYYDALLRIAGNDVLERVYLSHEVHLLRVQFQSLYIRYGQERIEEMNSAILAGKADVAELLGRNRTSKLLEQIDALPDDAFRQS